MFARRWSVAVLLACAGFTAHGAFDPTDVVQIQATTGFAHDSNLYRLPDGDPTQFGIAPSNKSDTTRIMGVGLKIDKPISRQRLIADINFNETTYDKNTILDFVGGNARLAWLWQVGNHWSGEASFRRTRALGGFGDFRQSLQDLIDTDTLTVTAGYQIHPRWRVLGELTEIESTHSAVPRQALDYSSQTAGLTLTYRTPADNSIGLQVRRTEGNYPNRQTLGLLIFDNSFTETRLNAIAAWRASGLLRFDGQVGIAERSHETLSVRDYSGATWRAGAYWEPTAKFRLAVTGFKDIRNFEDIATSYVVVTGVGISPTYALAPKVVLQGDLTREARDYRGDPGFRLLSSPAREDQITTARVSVTYSPIRNIDLSLSIEAGERRSNINLSSYEYRSWFGSLRLGF